MRISDWSSSCALPICKVLGSIGSGNRDFASFDVDKNLWTFNNPADCSTTLGGVARILGMDVAGALDLAETTGLATTLAQPNLTSLSGETADRKSTRLNSSH